MTLSYFKKNIGLSVTLFIGLHSLSISQEQLTPEWHKIISSPIAIGNAEAWAIGADDNNLYWGVNMDMPGFFQYMDALLYKLDKNGNEVWIDTAVAKTFAQQSYNLKVTDSLVFLGGRTCNAANTDSCDALFFTSNTSTGATGLEFIWENGYGYEEIDGIHLEEDGIYLTGWSAGNGTKVDLLLMKIDYSGNVIWSNVWGSGTERDDHQDGHIVVDDSIIYVSGLWDGSPTLGWDGKALLAKFKKTDGSLVDSLTYGRDDIWFNAENALGMTSDGTYLYTTGYTTTSGNNWDLFLAKFDKNLNQIWHTTWGGTEAAETARAIEVAPDGSIYLGANTESYGSGEMDIALVKFDNNGNLLWYKLWGDTLKDQTLDIYLDRTDLYMTGKTTSFHSAKKWEALLLKINLNKITSSNLLNNSKPMTVYPNPSRDNFYVDLDKSEAIVELFDAKGLVVRSKTGTDKLHINTAGLKPGIYFLKVINPEKKTSRVSKVIVE